MSNGKIGGSSTENHRNSKSATKQAAQTDDYIVKRGDTLNAIARNHKTSVGDLMKANAGQISNCNLIYPGQKLHLPAVKQQNQSTKKQTTQPKVSGKKPTDTITKSRTPSIITPKSDNNKVTKSVAPPTSTTQTVSNSNYKSIDLDDFLDKRKVSNALAAIVIGNAEGNRFPDGKFKPSYYGHTDPGDKKHNLGSFSYNPRGSGQVANTPEEADKIYLGVLAGRRAKYEKAVKDAGLDPNNSLLASTCFDASNQSPRTGDKMLAQLDYIKKNGITPETMKEWRFRGYVNHETGQRWAYKDDNGKTTYAGGGFNTVFKSRHGGRTPSEAELQETIKGDQNRRIDALVGALDKQGYKTGNTNNSSQLSTVDNPPTTASKSVTPIKGVNVGAIDTVLPPRGTGYVTYNREKDGADQYGTAKTIKALEIIGERWNENNKSLPIQIGDISRKGGGAFPPHGSHQKGTNADIRPFRKDGQQLPITWQDKTYNREKTRELIKVIKETYPNVIILFNDSVLIKEGLTRQYKGHDNHLHVDFK